MPDDRFGGWTQTFRGRKFFPLDPRPEDVCVEDVAHALSMVCRFGGHIRSFYSVAEHSVRLSHECRPDAALFGLLHDASEAYLGDIPRPWKSVLRIEWPAGTREMETIREAEDHLLRVILEGLGVPEPSAAVRAVVKGLDVTMLVTEARDLLACPPLGEWHHMPDRYRALPDRIIPWAPDRAEREFLGRYRELTGL